MRSIDAIANDFANRMTLKGYNLDFSLSSLEIEIDRILESTSSHIDDSEKMGVLDRAGIEAYVGETLAKLFGGTWQGEFKEKTPAQNFYLSSIKFGGYSYYPSHFLGYRISNGPVEGEFKNHLKAILKKINEGISSV